MRSRPESGQHPWLGWRRRSEAWNNAALLEDVSPRSANDKGFVRQSGFRLASLHVNRRLGAQALAGLPLYEFEAQVEIGQSQTLRDARCLGGRAGRRGDFTPSAAWLLAGHGAQHRRLGPLGPDQQRARSGGRLHAPRTLLLALASNPSAWLSFVRDAQGRRGFTKRSAQTLAVLHFSARDPLRSIIQNSHFERRAEAL